MNEVNDLQLFVGMRRFHVNPRDAEKVSLVDEAIQELQTLGDLYVRYLAIDGGVPTKPADVALLDDVLKAFAKSYLSYKHAVAAVAASVTGTDDQGDWDF